MVRRTMVMMGLLAFALCICGGLISGNSFEFTLSKALWAMFLFSILGIVIGWSATHVVKEYRTVQHREVFGVSGADNDAENNSTS